MRKVEKYCRVPISITLIHPGHQLFLFSYKYICLILAWICLLGSVESTFGSYEGLAFNLFTQTRAVPGRGWQIFSKPLEKQIFSTVRVEAAKAFYTLVRAALETKALPLYHFRSQTELCDLIAEFCAIKA